MPACAIAEPCAARLLSWEDGELVFESEDPRLILAVLSDIERELIVLGGSPDPELADSVVMVDQAFPGTRLIEVRKPRK